MDTFCDNDIQKNQTGFAITFKVLPYMLRRENPRAMLSGSDSALAQVTVKSKYTAPRTSNNNQLFGLPPYSACSASFFSHNSVFLSQQFNQNSVFQPVSDQRTGPLHDGISYWKGAFFPLSNLMVWQRLIKISGQKFHLTADPRNKTFGQHRNNKQVSNSSTKLFDRWINPYI